MPLVSVIIAAFEAEDFLGDAIASALAQSFGDLEILIAPDEPRDYSGFAGRDPRIRVLPGVSRPTGPGPARNRAMDAARGDWLALLDADDLWSPDYLEILVPAAEAKGAAFGRTSVRAEDGSELRSIPAAGASQTVDFSIFERAFGSFHAVTRRRADRRWRDVFAEDVLFDLESLSLAGGTAPYDPRAVYVLRSRPNSATRSPGFAAGIGAQYTALTAMIAQGGTLVGPEHRAAAIGVFESWARTNESFLLARVKGPDLTFQKYVASLTR